jgi:hypothetical protein
VKRATERDQSIVTDDAKPKQTVNLDITSRDCWDGSCTTKFKNKSVQIVLILRVKLPCPKCKILIVREILVLSFIASEENRKKDGRCIGAST